MSAYQPYNFLLRLLKDTDFVSNPLISSFNRINTATSEVSITCISKVSPSEELLISDGWSCSSSMVQLQSEAI